MSSRPTRSPLGLGLGSHWQGTTTSAVPAPAASSWIRSPGAGWSHSSPAAAATTALSPELEPLCNAGPAGGFSIYLRTRLDTSARLHRCHSTSAEGEPCRLSPPPPPLLTLHHCPLSPGLTRHLQLLRGMPPTTIPTWASVYLVERGGFPGGKATCPDTPAQNVHLSPSSRAAPGRTRGLARKARRRGKKGHREEMRREHGRKESATSCPSVTVPSHQREQLLQGTG